MAIIQETTDAIDLSGHPTPAYNYTIELGDTFVGSFDDPSDADGLRVLVESGWNYVLEVERVGAEGTFYADLGPLHSAFIPRELQFYEAEIGPDGAAVAGHSTSGRDLGVLAAQLASGGYVGDYRATLTRELASTIPSEARVEVGQNFQSTLGFETASADRNGDADVIGVRLEAGTPYRFGVTGDWTPSDGRTLEVIRRAAGLDPYGEFDIFVRAEFQTEKASVAFIPQLDGLYYVRIRQQPGTEGASDYSLAVREEDGRALIGDDADNRLEGTEADDRIEGRAGDDSLSGLSGNDLLFGGPGNDFLQGWRGDDTLNGGPGADAMRGFTGSDTYVVDHPGDTIWEEPDFDNDTFNLIPDVDRVLASVNFDLVDDIEGSVEVIEGTGTRDLRLGGSGYDQAIIGNSGDNILMGNGGDDTMTGGAGRDAFAVSMSQFDGVSRARSITVTDFEAGDRLAVEDRLLGLGGEAEEVRRLTRDVFDALKASGRVEWDEAAGTLAIDTTGNGQLAVVADLGADPDLSLGDVWLF